MSRTVIKCRVCGFTEDHPRYIVKEMMYGTANTFPYFQCQQCGCLQIETIPDDMAAFYPASYYSFTVRTEGSQTSAIQRKFEKWIARQSLFDKGYKVARLARSFVRPPPALAVISKLLKPCKLKSFATSFLDVGCGAQSWWLDDLNSLGFTDLTGVDPFIEHDRSFRDTRIKCGSIFDIDRKFDVISMHHSLEHVPDQVAALDAIRQRLNLGGCCLIRVPLSSSTVWEKYKTNWVELDAPRHLYLHSVESLKILARKAGLNLEHHFFDAVDFEFWGSEQYARGIPLRAPNSFATNPGASDFTFKEMAEFNALAAEANATGRGGRAAFYFRAA